MDHFVEFGPYILDVAGHRLLREGIEIPLAPKTFEVLQALVRSNGRALTKDYLITTLWPGTFVEESSLSFQIASLRKALGEPGAQWIETVPKVGYRFTAAVFHPEPPGAAVEQPLARSTSVARLWRLALMGLLVIASIGGVAWFVVQRLQSPPVHPVPAISPVTSYPGNEIHPALSPDGQMVAFAWDRGPLENYEIYVKMIGPGEPIQLTSDAASDFAPAWSPDGKSIAFLRGPIDGVVSVFVTAAMGGSVPRKIAEVNQPMSTVLRRVGIPNANLTWTPDGGRLAVTSNASPILGKSAHRIILLDVQTGNASEMTAPPAQGSGDFAPAFSSDGRKLAFVRATSLTESSLLILPLTASRYQSAGQPWVAATGHGFGEPKWINDRELVFSAGPNGSRRLYRLAVDKQLAAGPPTPLPFGEGALAIGVSANGRLVYSQSSWDSDIWQFDAGRSVAEPIIASTRDDQTPGFSPDGSRIVFTSKRSGQDEIWTANIDGSNLRQVTNFAGPLVSNPRWSPDGKWIVFDARGTGVAIVNPSTAEIRQIDPRAGQPRWSRDGAWIYFTSARTGTMAVWKVPANGGNASQLLKDAVVAVESGDSSYLYYSAVREGATSLWRVRSGAGAGAPEKIADDLSNSINFDASHSGVFFLSEVKGGSQSALRYFDGATRRVTNLFTATKRFSFGVSARPDGSRVLFSLSNDHGSDLIVADGFR